VSVFGAARVGGASGAQLAANIGRATVGQRQLSGSKVS
jgi:hypothetical protein